MRNRKVKKKKSLIVAVLLLAISPVIKAQDLPAVLVDVNLDVNHRIGEVTTFDRSKFITIHSDHTDRDWDGDNFTPDLRDHFLNGYNVYMGRSTGGISWVLRNQAIEDPARPGHVLESNLASLGLSSRNSYAGKTWVHPYQARDNKVICAQFGHFWPDGTQTNKGWALSQADTPEEPFGTATGEYMGLYIKHYFGGNGPKPPPWVEIINEPLWELVTNGSTPPADIFEFHNNVAAEIRRIYPDILIGGYTAAFPDFDTRNFDRWHERDKLFIDMSGAHMDFISLHFYDFPAIGGKQKYRKGSNIEATFDMMEQYSKLTHGKVIPFEVSEYGAQTHDYNNKPWSPYRDWLKVKSINSMLLSFMERADKMLMTMPFTMLKNTWWTGEYPHGSRLMRQAFEMEGETGDHWVYTHQVLFYQLWSDVKGTRVDSWATDLDFLTDAFVDGNNAYVIVNNLEFNPRAVGINLIADESNQLQETEVKHLYLNGSTPVLDSTLYFEDPPRSLTLGSEGTMVIRYTYENPIVVTDSSVEEKLYADSYLQEIVADQAIDFEIDSANTGSNGEAILRLGLGRDHGLSLTPEIHFNDSALAVPVDFRGGNQTQRDNFFGVIEVPVPYPIIRDTNSISVKFSDNGGYVSSVALQTFDFSREINRSEKPDRFTATVTVLREEDDQPLEGADVVFGDSSLQTDNSGVAILDSLQAGTYAVTVTAPGFEQWHAAEVQVTDNLHLTVRLQPVMYAVSFEISEKDLKIPVYNAGITAGLNTVASDEEGKASLTLPLGAVSLLVEKDYFRDHQSTLDVTRDTLISVTLERLFADAKFRIWNADGSSRERDAQVSLDDTTVISNTLGLATFKALKVDTVYHYSVSKTGFQVQSGDLILKKDTTIVVNLLVGSGPSLFTKTSVSIFPVPAESFMKIEWLQGSDAETTVQVADLAGRIVLSEKLKGRSGSNSAELDLTGLDAGIYTVSLRNEGILLSGKLIKK